MTSSKEHYANVLSPVYAWMYGGFEAALARNSAFFAESGIAAPRLSGRVVDLGAGCGFQSIPLAQLGYRVTAIDLDPGLLGELAAAATDLPIERIEGDLLDFRRHVADGLELAICMVDTVLHLESRAEVHALFKNVHAALESGGRFVLSFRDLTRELEGLERFIPVRSDENTIFTCFLEYEADVVKVHDLVYRRLGGVWQFSRSFYRKLRLSAEWIRESLTTAGFERIDVATQRGMTVVIATHD